MGTDAYHALQKLIDDLESCTLPSPEQVRALNEPFRREAFERLFDSGITYGQVSGSPLGKLLTGDTAEVKQRLRSIANDLGAQVGIVTACIDFFRKTGEPVPPAYAWRIAVMLRKKREYALEARFLAAYAKHFCNNGLGRTEAALLDRLPKARTLAAKRSGGS